MPLKEGETFRAASKARQYYRSSVTGGRSPGGSIQRESHERPRSLTRMWPPVITLLCQATVHGENVELDDERIMWGHEKRIKRGPVRARGYLGGKRSAAVVHSGKAG